MKKVLFILLICLFPPVMSGQNLGMTFQEAEKQGLSIKHLDSLYTSAVHTNPSLAVFKTEKEQQALQQAYGKLLQDLGRFLAECKFKWEKPARCFNRIYFSPNGTIDYFLFNFIGTPEDKPNLEQQKIFTGLLNRFIKEYRFGLTAKIKFAQCSPTVYKSSQ
jgi:hypothetical protein